MYGLKDICLIVIIVFATSSFAQDVELYQQFNGRYDYIAFGNTLNIDENSGPDPSCDILTESSAEFTLAADQTIIAAYLYWAGSGDGDFEVVFGNMPIAAERTFVATLNGTLFYFAAFADVTALLQAQGNGVYTLSELDLTEDIIPFCDNTTNFGGWAVTVIYEDPDLNLNQVNVFDGLEGVSAVNQELIIVLDNLNVLDNEGAKIGFLAWEGDLNIAITETLQINNNILSNLPLNPPENAFNGTNSFTGSNELYNMDIDFYSIEEYIAPGDEIAEIKLTSGRDFIMVNNVITVLNQELPDATIALDNVEGSTECGDTEVEIEYTVFNTNSTDTLPQGTPIAFYANSTLIGQASTLNDLEIGESESGSIILIIPEQIPADFQLLVVVDDDGMGNSTVTELNENNNEATAEIHLLLFPEIVGLQNLELCDVVGIEIFDLTLATSQIDPVNTIEFYLTEADANAMENPIVDPENFINTSNPQTIWIRVSNQDCFVIESFEIEVIVCPLPDATITIDNNLNACRERDLSVEYTIYNISGTAPLPSGTKIAFYINDILVAQSQTVTNIPEGGTEAGNIELTIDESTPNNFELTAVVDDDGAGNGQVEELNELNNAFLVNTQFMSIPPIGELPQLIECDLGFNKAIFDLTELFPLIMENSAGSVTFYTTQIDAQTDSNPIVDPEQYENTVDTELIFVRLENEICFDTSSFTITTENCVPFIPEGFSPNGDTFNDLFEITGLLNVFEDFNLKIFSRNGNLIYEGGNSDGFWNAIPNKGLLYNGNVVPVGTYFYILNLNDPDHSEPFLGSVYVNY